MFGRQLDIDPQHGQPTFVAVAADVRRTAGEGDADVEVIRVFQGARAEHAVGVDHGVGLGPHDLFAEARLAVQQVGRAGVAHLRAHLHVGIAQRGGGLAEGLVDAQFAPAAVIHGDGIQGGRHLHLAAPVRQLAGEAQAGGAGIDAAVDVRLGDVQQVLRALQRGHAQDDLHGGLGGLAVLAVEQLMVAGGEHQAFRQGAGIAGHHALPAIGRALGGECYLSVFDTGPAARGQLLESLVAQAQHRDGAAEQRLRHQHAEGEDLVRLGQQQGCRRMAVEQYFQHHAAAGTGAASAGNRQHPPGQEAAGERMVAVDDLARERLYASPEAQPGVGME